MPLGTRLAQPPARANDSTTIRLREEITAVADDLRRAIRSKIDGPGRLAALRASARRLDRVSLEIAEYDRDMTFDAEVLRLRRALSLGPSAGTILLHLVRASDTVVRYAEICELIGSTSDSSIKVFIVNIRSVLKPVRGGNVIRNLRGQGYWIAGEDAAAIRKLWQAP